MIKNRTENEISDDRDSTDNSNLNSENLIKIKHEEIK